VFASGGGVSGPLGGSPGTLIVATNGVPVDGTYYINGNVLLDVAGGDGVYCFAVDVTSGGGGEQGGSNTGGFQQASVTNSVFAFAGDVLGIYCYSATNNASSSIFNSGINAVLIDQPFNAAKTAAKGKAAVRTPTGPVNAKVQPR
jgi:hypothetical protein